MRATLVLAAFDARSGRAVTTQVQREFAAPETVGAACAALGWPTDGVAYSASIWGQRVAWDTLIADGDRVELCRDLLLEPKLARAHRVATKPRRGWVARSKTLE